MPLPELYESPSVTTRSMGAGVEPVELACAVVALLGGCVIAGDVRPYAAMAPIQPIMPPQAAPTTA